MHTNSHTQLKRARTEEIRDIRSVVFRGQYLFPTLTVIKLHALRCFPN